jgi:hypothetical protein
MTDEERQRFARRLRERDAEIERLRAESAAELAKALLEIDGLYDKLVLAVKQIDVVTAENEQLRAINKDVGIALDIAAGQAKPDLRALLPELAVIRQVMKDTKP